MTDFRHINRKFLLEFIELCAVFRVYGKYIHCIQIQLDIYSLIKTFNKPEVCVQLVFVVFVRTDLFVEQNRRIKTQYVGHFRGGSIQFEYRTVP
jgi:hypothetical protein